ncbi:MAG TPA: hypothetical protein VHO84_02550 [Syntrophorhabdaceae bacterium]|nr:hypothetical protein [Syntrophorhabdaceae bacterium]
MRESNDLISFITKTEYAHLPSDVIHDVQTQLDVQFSIPFVAAVEVKAKGKLYTEQTLYPKGTNFTEYQATDDELVTKFRNNASRILIGNKIDNAMECIFELDKLQNVSELTSLLVL